MKPIYFPFTYLPTDVMEALGLFFRQVVVYQPSDLPIPEEMAAWVQSGRLTVRIPIDSGSDELAQAVKAYHVWASHHQGSELAFFKTSKEAIPFYGESSVQHIRSQIRQKQEEGGQAGQPHAETDRHLMQARLFLQMAQAFDAEQWSVHNSLASHVAMERDMLKNLQGETEDPDPRALMDATAGSGRPGGYMIVERLAAWGALMRCDSEAGAILVTDNRDVLASLLEGRPEIVEVGRWEGLRRLPAGDATAWQLHFEQYLDRLATETWPVARPDLIAPPSPGSTEDSAALTVYLAVARDPRELLGSGAPAHIMAATEICPAAPCRNTVIALVTT